MEFRILGPLEVVVDGEVVDVGAGKQRALLAALLLAPNRSVSKDDLIDAVWGERPTETASKGLLVYISHLRKAIGRDRILTHAHGYELRVEPGELDVEQFQTLVAERRLDDALALWRGQPLADFAYEPFAQSEIARLSELRLGCIEDRVDAELKAERHAAVVGELEGLVRAHPLRERLRAQLMLALYRSGRQAEALDAYAAGRTILSEELGLEPGAELRELQRAILAQDPALLPPERPTTAPETPEPEHPSVQGKRVAREARKTVSVLHCDLVAVGAPLDPESLRRVIELGFAALLPTLERRAATVERSLAGAVTAIFGLPAVHEDDAVRAVTAASEMRDALAELRGGLEEQWGAWLELRAGIATGEVVAGRDGDQTYAAGAPVAAALRLQQSAEVGVVLLDERTHRLMKDGVDAESDGDGFRLVHVRHDRERNRSDAPMVGRERERRRLDDAFEQVRSDRSCQLFTILGAPGVGKSRLVREFVASVGDDAVVARGRCLPYGEGITYWPVLEALRDAAGLDDGLPREVNLERLAAVVADDEDADAVTRRLGEVAGLVEQTSGAEETFRAVRTFLAALAQRRPLVLVFDDIHWGELTFLDLVDYIADWTHDAPVLLLCVARPELHDIRPHWGGGKLNATSVQLEPLSDAESAELVDSLAGARDLDQAARRHVVEAAAGNPLFAEEMLALVLERGGDLDAFEVPPTIQALLAARLDRLSPDERAAIEAAAVEGQVFHEASVQALTGEPPEAVRNALLALVRRDLVRTEKPVFSGERGYRFRHLLIRDAAYASIPKAARASLHARHAGWLDEEDRALELDEIVGYHYEQAFGYRAELGPIDDATRALGSAGARRLGAAGRRALVRSDGPAGVNLISRSVALLSPDDPLRVELVPNVRVIQGLHDLTWADRVLTEAIEAAATSGDRALASHALVQRGFLRLFTAEGVTPRELFDISDRAIAVFESLGDELGLARAWRLVSQAHYLEGRPGLCAEASERAWEHARRACDRFEQREIVEWLVIVLLLGPAPATQAAHRLAELLDETHDLIEAQAQIRAGLATIAAMQGDLATAREFIEVSRQVMDDLSEWIWIVAFWWGFIHLWSGELATAEAEVRPAYEALKKIGEKSHFSSMAHSLAAIAYAQARYEEAERFTRECEEACRANDIHSQIMWRAIRAKVLARRRAFEEAEHLAEEAVALAESGDFLLAHAEAVADQGEVFELAGKPGDAARAYERSIELFELKGVVIPPARTRERLELLTS